MNLLRAASRFFTKQRPAPPETHDLSTLLDNVPDAVISSDLDFTVHTWNRGAEEIYGWTREEVIGRKIYPLIQTEIVGMTRDQVVSELNTRGRWKAEVTQLRKDGTRIPILASSAMLTDAKGRHIGIVSINRDISERKQLEAELLESRMRQIELEKERQLLDLKNDFLSMVSHEFRTPLSVIMTSTEILERYRDRMTPERSREHTQKISEQVAYMTQMMNEVLMVDRARAGKLEAHPAPLPLADFCRDIVEHVLVATKRTHEIALTVEGVPESPALDANLLQHILVNLLSNAIKYSPGRDRIYFNVSGEPGEIVFCVKDEGMGIPRSEQDRLFQPFFRASNTEDIVGTGLGLVIARNSIEAHGGRIEVESEEGVGTTITVRLPCI